LPDASPPPPFPTEVLRVLIAGGGTGGHIIPGLAIADELRLHHGAEIAWVGTERGLETRLVPAAGYPLHLVEVGQLKGVSLRTRLATLTAVPRALLACKALLRQFRPQVVIGVGGYASGPAMMAAVLDRTPTLAFEPNAAPGLTNRLIGRWVSGAAVNFPAAARFFRCAEVTGIPVRPEFFALPQKDPASAPHILVFGGSQGARALNTRMPEIAPRLLEAVPGLTILHQAGARHAEGTRQAYEASGAAPDRWQVQAFLEDMPARFAAADLVLARSGASTVAELCAAGKPSLLVPFPQATDDHQRKNAEVLAQAGAALLLPDSEMSAERLLTELLYAFSDRVRIAEMGDRARVLAHPDATTRIAAMAVRLAQKKTAGRSSLPAAS
jgi:UDP-N-acetylglucosamine--N-acetylmuramyl-(pentapeptide) pyrophosphoryl-undecaprenol N-acetylglucosamine transferase